MTAIGHFSLLTETPTNPSIVTFFLKLQGPTLPASDLRQLWKTNMARHERFGQVVSPSQQGYLEAAPHDDRITETVSMDPAQIQHLIRHWQVEPWDYSQQLWQLHVAQQKRDDSSLLIFRGHHVLADGASMGAALLELADEAEELQQAVVDLWNKYKGKKRTFLERLQRHLQKLWWLVAGSIQSLLYQSKLLFYSFWTKSPWALLAKHSQDQRSIAYATAAPLDQVKWVARTLVGDKGTVNDVWVSCVTAALARLLKYHRRRLTEIEDKTVLPPLERMHVTMPVHLRGGVILPNESVSNQLGAMVARLPGESDDMDPVERLRRVHKELSWLKRTPTAFLSHTMARGVGFLARTVLPTSWASSLFASASAGSSVVVTNVRGPPRKLHIQGREVEELYGFVPLPPGIPCGVVVYSYSGMVNLSISSEAWLDSNLLLQYTLEEYIKLVEVAKS